MCARCAVSGQLTEKSKAWNSANPRPRKDRQPHSACLSSACASPRWATGAGAGPAVPLLYHRKDKHSWKGQGQPHGYRGLQPKELEGGWSPLSTAMQTDWSLLLANHQPSQDIGSWGGWVLVRSDSFLLKAGRTRAPST